MEIFGNNVCVPLHLNGQSLMSMQVMSLMGDIVNVTIRLLRTSPVSSLQC
jgi:hypothetical protein